MECAQDIVYTPQEKRILEGKFYDVSSDQLTPGRARVYRMLEPLRGQIPRVSMERAKLFTESFRETEGEHLSLRWAKALMHVVKNISLYIGPDDLIVGRSDGLPGRHGLVFPELEGSFLDSVADMMLTNKKQYVLSEEDAATMREISTYWKGKTVLDRLYQGLPEETRRLIFAEDNYFVQKYIITQTASTRSSLQWVPDYNKAIHIGFAAIRRQAEERLNALDPRDPKASLEQEGFLKAVITTCDAVILFSNRYSALAASMADQETNAKRKAELKKISEICRRVPENPSRTFHEAIQAHWMTQCFSRLEQRTSAIVSNGRLDQLLYPFYKKELAAGTLTDDDVLELLESLWINIAQFTNISISPQAAAFYEGHAHWEAVTIGGKLPDGRDATNELTYLILRSKREFPLNYPDLAARIHSQSPDKYLLQIAETIKEGSGFPKIFNDEEIIPLYLAKGVPLSHANDYSASGCSEVRAPNVDTYIAPCPWINLGAVLEMAFNDGRLRHFGNERFGVATGDPTKFASFEEVWKSYVAQQEYILKQAFMLQCVIEKVRAQVLAVPLFSAMHDLCMEQCKDLQSNDVKSGASLGFFDLIGFGTVIDSLAAVKQLVFDEKKLNMKQIMDAVNADFEGYEDIHQMLFNCPKYGNNDPRADEIGFMIEREAALFAHKYRTNNDTELDLRYVPVTSHIPLGKVVWATPNGRKAHTYLSEGSSASHGADVKGPTAVLMSNVATKFTGVKERASRLLNIKLNPAIVAGLEGSRKIMALLRTFSALKLWHLQFNIINRDTLLRAQKDPDKYRNLLVRVAGYSAYFVDLSPGLQEEIISRMEHTTL
jgi:pyruvate formate-lyase/glycerol dehydratase family glycyl radical enzyme